MTMTRLLSLPLLLVAVLVACAPVDDVGPAPGDPTPTDPAPVDPLPQPVADAGPPQPVDAGPADAGQTADAGHSAEPALCDPAAHLACSSFEDGLPAPGWTVPAASAAVVAVDTTRAAHGVRSLKLRPLAPGAGSTAVVSTTAPFPAARDVVFGRAFYWVPSPAPGPHAVQLATAYSSGPAPRTQWSVGFRRGLLHANVNDPVVGEIHRASVTALPTDRWFCLEWMFDGRTPALQVWLDGVPITDLKANGWPVAEWQQLQVGVRKHSEATDPPAGYELWVDDVAVDEARIGCGP